MKRIPKEHLAEVTEALLSTALSSLPELISYISTEFKYLYCNSAYEAFFGVKAEYCIGKHVSEVIGLDAYKGVEPYLAKAFKGKTIEFRKSLSYKLGGRKIVDVRYHPVKGSDGSVSGVIAIVQDVSGKVEKESNFQTVVETMNEGYLRFDAAGKILEFNLAALEVLGLPESELKGLTTQQINLRAIRDNGEFIPERENPIYDSMKTGRPVTGVLMRLQRPDPANIDSASDNTVSRWVRVSVSPMATHRVCSDPMPGVPAEQETIWTFFDVTSIMLSQSNLKNSEEAFRAIFENSPIGIVQTDSRLGFLRVNQAFQEMVGYSEVELKKMTAVEITHPEDRESSSFAAEEALSSVPVKKFEKRYIHKSGKVVWVRLSSRSITLGQAGERFLFTSVEDVTEARNAEQTLGLERERFLRASERFRAIFFSNPNPVLVFGESGIIDCNPATVKILGAKTKDEILSKHPAYFSPEFQPDGKSSSDKSKEMDQIARQNGRYRFEWMHRKLDGTDFPVDVTIAPIGERENNFLLVLWDDLTVKKQRDLQILHSSKLASMGEMSAGIAHEINNPLAIISGAVTLLPKFTDNPEKLKSKIETIEKSVERISKIVLGLKKFSRSSDRQTYNEVSLSSIIQEAVDLTQSKARLAMTSVAVDCQTEGLVSGNEIEIEQILINLINNSVDAVEGLPEKWIKISLFERDNKIVLQVRDSGRGIPEATRDKIFQPFYTTKPVGKGTGLGLSIVKGILDEHHAGIQVLASDPNTCFEIQFPKSDARVEPGKQAA